MCPLHTAPLPQALGLALPGHSWSTLLTAALEESKAFLPCPQEMPLLMELLCWSPAVSQQCPWPVPACGHSTDTQQDSDQAARALRPCSHRRVGRRGWGWEEQMWEEPGPLSLAVLLCWESLPFTSADRDCPAETEKG